MSKLIVWNLLPEPADDLFICVSLGLLATKLATQFSDSEQKRIVGLGTSGLSFARQIVPNCSGIPIETVSFDRDRAKRRLSVQPSRWLEPILMVDDIAVSGRTVQSAAAAVSPSVSAVGLGMLYNSRTTRRLIDVTDVRAACVYQREGGGLPPINSVATLRAVPERLDELAGRYFNNCDVFKNAMRRTDYAR